MGSVTAGTQAYDRARKALTKYAEGDIAKGNKHAARALLLANPVIRVWSPV